MMARLTDAKAEGRKGQEAGLENAVQQIEKQYGRGAIMRMAGGPHSRIPTIPTGALSLDIALGVGGLPKGRIVEIYGGESSGKTTMTLHVVANAQKAGGVCAFIDAEHALDPAYASKLGVKMEDLLVSQPGSGEEALDIAETLVRSNAVDVLVIDSVAALVPRAEIEGDMGDSHMGLQARLMSQALRKLTAAISRSNTCVIFINQVREKIGVMFGNPETTTGGRALKFYASVRIEINRITAIKVGEVVTGNRTRAKVVKNKVAPPFRRAEFDIIYGEGVCYASDVLDLAEEAKIVSRSGSWYTYKGTQLAQGRDKAVALLQEKPDSLHRLAAEVRRHFLPPVEGAPAEAAEAAAGGKVEKIEKVEEAKRRTA